MVASTDIKVFVHTNNNAPQLQNAYGSMINVLDACLVNGINIGSISSLTASGVTVTALFSSAHNLMQYQVIKITGAAQSEFNGEHRVLTVPNAQSVTFELASVPSAGSATGVISASLPPLGWEKPFSSTNEAGGGKAAYRSTNLLLPSRPFLRVVDEPDSSYTTTYAKYAKVGIVEDMTDINTMLGVQAPYDAAAPTKNWVGTGSGTAAYNGWAKWYYATGADFKAYNTDSNAVTSGNRAWVIIGNTDYFYILPTAISLNTNHITYGFGAFKSLLLTDSSNTFLSATRVYQTASIRDYKPQNTPLSSDVLSNKLILQRLFNQTANQSEATVLSLKVSVDDIYSGYSNYINASILTNVAPFAALIAKEVSNNVIRGEIPNIFWLFQIKPYNHLQVFEKNRVLYIAINIAHYNGYEGQIIYKIGEL
ncbi:hypothetical protein [Acinetobacter terrae]|uniref:Uncharacterized protein n=1 Tax=Acinetobacter terrae TaxID=2731247 RepID=A0A4R0ELU7_9GAMM|nr:hypothetical protein [Acinetobacter terrae]TCB58638.1 hypothetical protein E0H85_10265 [Acinetobacter terrae]